MYIPYPQIYVMSKQAIERYCREEGIPLKPLPDLIDSDEDVLAWPRQVVQAVRGALTALRPSRQPLPGVAQSSAVAK